MRKSFSEILMPAISRRNALTWVVETARTLPELSRYWNMRLPGTSRRMPMARTSFAASHSLRTALPPLALKVSTTLSSSSVDVGLQQRGGAAGAVEAGVGFIAGADRGARDQFDHRREREFAGRRVARQVHRDVAADFWQRRDQPRQPMRLALLADLFPVGVIAVLQPARGIAADGLQMRVRIGRIADLGIGRRHRHRVQAPDGAGMADRRAVGANEGIVLAALDAADGQFVLVAELQAQFFGEGFDARGVSRRDGSQRNRRKRAAQPQNSADPS